MSFFASGFAKGILLDGQRRPPVLQEEAFGSAKGHLLDDQSLPLRG